MKIQSRIALLVCATVSLEFAASGCGHDERQRANNDNDRMVDDPVFLEAAHLGRFRDGDAWKITVRQSGKAELTLFPAYKQKAKTELAIDLDKMRTLQKAIRQFDFPTLPDRMGEFVVDTDIRRLKIFTKGLSKEIEVWSLGANTHATDAEIANCIRFLNIWIAVRNLFESTAVDLRKEDIELLDELRQARK